MRYDVNTAGGMLAAHTNRDPSTSMSRRPLSPEQRQSNAALGKRIASIRKERGFTQVELAGRIGISQAAISNYESGRLRPHPELLRSLADLLESLPTGCSVRGGIAEGARRNRDRSAFPPAASAGEEAPEARSRRALAHDRRVHRRPQGKLTAFSSARGRAWTTATAQLSALRAESRLRRPVCGPALAAGSLRQRRVPRDRVQPLGAGGDELQRRARRRADSQSLQHRARATPATRDAASGTEAARAGQSRLPAQLSGAAVASPEVTPRSRAVELPSAATAE